MLSDDVREAFFVQGKVCEALGVDRHTLTLWPSGETRILGHIDFHGRFTHWL